MRAIRFPGSCSESADIAFASRLNHSTALSAAAWMLTLSILVDESRALPPCLHSLKQFQSFLEMLTLNCVGLSLVNGHGPLSYPAPLERVKKVVVA